MKLLVAIFFTIKFFTVPPDSNLTAYVDEIPNYKQELLKIKIPTLLDSSLFVYNEQMFSNQCDTLGQVRFWRSVMRLHKDTAFLNLPKDRKVLCTVCVKDFDSLDEEKKMRLKDSLRFSHLLTDSARILLTAGKSFFYDFDKASLNFDKGIKAFIENGVDPWYAQAILLIESPNKLQKSNAGAYGSFQLMKDVARMYGLKVNKKIDERADFNRSAFAASSLIKKICIPYTKKILDSLGIKDYKENELWFRLLVMHSYHAGAGNVRKALFTFMPTKGDMNLIYTLWQTETKNFRSASQNYSQLVLAAMFEVHEKFKIKPVSLPPPLLQAPNNRGN